MDIISIDGWGKQAQIKGLREGNAKIDVWYGTTTVIHGEEIFTPLALYPLSIYIRVTNDEAPVYLTTKQNVVTTTVGHSVILEAEMVNGKPGQSGINWSTQNSQIVSLDYNATAGGTAYIVGKAVGIARIEAYIYVSVGQYVDMRSVYILVVVESDPADYTKYFTTDTQLIDIKPGDNRQLMVQLVNGTIGDQSSIKWSIFGWEAYLKPNNTNPQVIELQSIGNVAVVKGLLEGEATITVSSYNPEVVHVLTIKVFVRNYSKVAFEQGTLVIDEGQSANIAVQCPPGNYMYFTNNESILTVNGTNSVCHIEALKPGVAIVTVTNGIDHAELLVQVRAVPGRVSQYIQTPSTIYTMTNWQSALNRNILTGKAIGEKNNGQLFTDIDDAGIVWEVVGYNDNNIRYAPISFRDSGYNQTYTETGKSVSIYPNSVGNATVKARHPQMASDYAKEIYVFVEPFDETMYLNPVLLNMNIEETQQIEAKILNDDGTGIIKWFASKNEKGEYGIESGGYQAYYMYSNLRDDELEVLIGNPYGYYYSNLGYRTINITPKLPGTYTVWATYNGKKIGQDCVVYVPPKKSFEILGDKEGVYGTGYISILPDQVVDIEYTSEPVGTVPNTVTSSTRHVDVQLCSPDADHKNPYIRLTGKKFECYTTVTMTLNGIQRIFTVNTNRDFQFYFKGVIEYGGNTLGELSQALHNKELGKLVPSTAVRGKPGSVVLAEYMVYPEKDEVKLMFGGHYRTNEHIKYLSYDDSDDAMDKYKYFNNVYINRETQRILLRLNNCGYTELEFTGKYYLDNDEGMFLTIPTFIYNDSVDIKWSMHDNYFNYGNYRGNKKSRMDGLKNAIYVADGETFELAFEMLDDQFPYAYGKISYGTQVKLKVRSFPSTDSNISINGAELMKQDTAIKGIGIQNRHNYNITNTYSDALLDVNYVGLLTVTYSYFNGGREESSFDKSFLVYNEKWSRKAP
jgi:hypothetical protein